MPRLAPLALLLFAGLTPAFTFELRDGIAQIAPVKELERDAGEMQNRVTLAAFALPVGFLLESMIGWVCLLLFGGMVVSIIVLVRILARQGRLMNQAPPPRSGPVTFAGTADVQAVDDGFWIMLPDTPIGSMARFRCRVGAAERISTFRYEPGPRGHFIHLGGRPYDIDVLHVLPPGQPFGPGGQDAQRRDRWDDAQGNSPADAAGRPIFPDSDTDSSSGGGGDFGRPPPDITDPNAEDDSELGGGGDFGDPAPDVAAPASVPDDGTDSGSGGGGDFGGPAPGVAGPAPFPDSGTDSGSGGGGDFGSPPPAY